MFRVACLQSCYIWTHARAGEPAQGAEVAELVSALPSVKRKSPNLSPACGLGTATSDYYTDHAVCDKTGIISRFLQLPQTAQQYTDLQREPRAAFEDFPRFSLLERNPVEARASGFE